MSAAQAGADRSPTLAARLGRIAAWVGGCALVLFVLNLLGVPVSAWISNFWNQLRGLPTGTIAAAVVLDTMQTVFAAVSWLTILRAAFPDVPVPARAVVASYAVAVALNGFMPANIGTWVMMLMFVALIEGATFAAIFSGFVVQKIPFTVISILMYVYLFASVEGSLSFELPFISAHPGFTVLIAVSSILLIVIVCRVIWKRAAKLRQQLVNGSAVVREPRRFMLGVALPQVASFAARLGIVAVFLAAYSIPVSFHTVMAVTGANSISKSVSVTPGGAGVTQALNVVVLQGVTSTSNATSYSVAQQLVISAWDVIFALILVVWVFGWSGGKDLVTKSYAAATVKEHEFKEQQRAKREARRHRQRE